MTSAECSTAVVRFLLLSPLFCVGSVVFGPCFDVRCLVSPKACNLLAGGERAGCFTFIS